MANSTSDYSELLDRTKVSRQRKPTDPMTEELKEEIITNICKKVGQLIDLEIIKKTATEVNVLILINFKNQQ